jgi:hypothetical protein
MGQETRLALKIISYFLIPNGEAKILHRLTVVKKTVIAFLRIFG